MIELVEVKPLPQVYQECKEVKEFGIDAACYNCEYALERFEISKLDNTEEI